MEHSASFAKSTFIMNKILGTEEAKMGDTSPVQRKYFRESTLEVISEYGSQGPDSKARRYARPVTNNPFPEQEEAKKYSTTQKKRDRASRRLNSMVTPPAEGLETTSPSEVANYSFASSASGAKG